MAKASAVSVSTIRYWSQSAYRAVIMRGVSRTQHFKTVQGVKLTIELNLQKRIATAFWTENGREVSKELKIAQSWL